MLNNDDAEVEKIASIDRQVKTITEASLRRHLKLEDSNGITSLPNTDIFEQLALMGVDFPLFPTMITTLESSPSRITSSPSLSPQTYQSPQSSPLRDITIQDAEIPQSQFPTQTQVADEAAFTSVDVDARGAATTDIGIEVENDLQQIKKVYSSALIKLIMRVKKLEHRVKTRQPRRRARVIISDTEEDLEDPSKKGRRIAEIDQNPSISLILLDQEEPTELVEDLGSGEKGEKEICTANISVSTASATPKVSTAAANLVYIRKSEDTSLVKRFKRLNYDEDNAKKTETRGVDVEKEEGVKDATAASGSKPRSNTKKDRTLPAKSDKKKVEDHSRNNKSSVKQKNHVDSCVSYKHTQHTGRKFTLGEQCPVNRFTESKVVPIKQPKSVSTSDIVITERLSNTSQKPLTKVCNIAALVFGLQILKLHSANTHVMSVLERRNRTLVEAARTMLIFSKALMFLSAEAIATACYFMSCETGL
ncbi:hypothetical protein Tco_0440120 [Tanacetum coccineum]